MFTLVLQNLIAELGMEHSEVAQRLLALGGHGGGVTKTKNNKARATGDTPPCVLNWSHDYQDE